jgi:hypothetical protein
VERLLPELDETPAVVGYALRVTTADLWTVSAWSRRAALAAFDRGPLHDAAKRELRPLLRPPTVAVWSARVADLPPSWADVTRRIQAVGDRGAPD